MGIINLGQADNVIEEDGNGDIVANVDSVSTGEINVGGGAGPQQYLPIERIDAVSELNTSSPATSYTSVSLSALPSDAYGAYLEVISKGDGSSNTHTIQLREAGSGRSQDLEMRAWAGHSAFDCYTNGCVPVDSNNEVEYQTTNSQQAIIVTLGYF